MRKYNNELTTMVNNRPAVVEGDKVYYLVLKQVGDYKGDFDWFLEEVDNNVMYMVKDTETQGNKYIDYVTGTYWRCFKTKAEALEYVHKHQGELLFIIGFTQEDLNIIENM